MKSKLYIALSAIIVLISVNSICIAETKGNDFPPPPPFGHFDNGDNPSPPPHEFMGKRPSKEEMEAKKLEAIVRMRENHKTGAKFPTYRVKTKLLTEDNKPIWYDLKFTKDCKTPVRHSFVYVFPDNMNIDRRGKYPVVWVKQIEKIEEIKEDLTKYFD